MKRILMALSASTVLLGTMLVPSAYALVAASPGHGPVTVAVARQLPYERHAAIRVVYLGAGFSPPSVTLTRGEPLIVVVSHSVRASLAMTPGRSLVFNGQDGEVYLFSAKSSGMATIAARVRPRCETKACPQWRTAPDLVVTTY